MKPSPLELLFWLPLIAILVATGPALFTVPTVVALAGVRGAIGALLPVRRRRPGPWATRTDVQSAALIAMCLLLVVGVVIASRA